MILKKDFYQIQFKFDNVLKQSDGQDELYASVNYIVMYFLIGLNGTIFAYGQTGAGKTYSVIGENCELRAQNKGVLARAINQIFHAKSDQHHRKIKISFYEIYNEKIYDLFQNDIETSKGAKQKYKRKELHLKEEMGGNFSVEGLTSITVNSEKEALQYYEQGLKNRATKSSLMNSKSSRSHAIFEIYLEKESKKCKDLAGSEKCTARALHNMKNKEKHINELTSINGSLSALGQCISALADPKRTHIPFRNSKLTRVLKDSLDVASKIALIVCISPSIDSYKETVSTLQFADRAKKAVLQAQDNPMNSRSKRQLSMSKQKGENKLIANKEAYSKIKMLMRENSQLRDSLDELKNQIKFYKQSSQSTLMSPQPSTDVFHSQRSLDISPQLTNMVATKKPKKVKKKIKRKKADYLKPTSGRKSRSPPKKIIKSRNRNNQYMTHSSMRSYNSVNTLKSARKHPKRRKTKSTKKPKKQVRFNDRLLNEDSLDDEIIERIDHNQKYNDDTIFNNFSIFQQLAHEEGKEDPTDSGEKKESSEKSEHKQEISSPQKISLQQEISPKQKKSNLEESKNYDLKLNERKGHSQVEDYKEKSSEKVISPFEDTPPKGPIGPKELDPKELLDFQDLKELTIEDGNDEDVELISYHPESEQKEDDDKDLSYSEIEPSEKDKSNTSKQEDKSLFNPSVSYISDTSDSNTFIKGCTDFNFLDIPDAKIEDVTKEEGEFDQASEENTPAESKPENKPTDYHIINIESIDEAQHKSEEGSINNQLNSWSISDADVRTNSNPNDDHNDSIQSEDSKENEPSVTIQNKPNLFIKIEEDQSVDANNTLNKSENSEEIPKISAKDNSSLEERVKHSRNSSSGDRSSYNKADTFNLSQSLPKPLDGEYINKSYQKDLEYLIASPSEESTIFKNKFSKISTGEINIQENYDSASPNESYIKEKYVSEPNEDSREQHNDSLESFKLAHAQIINEEFKYPSGSRSYSSHSHSFDNSFQNP